MNPYRHDQSLGSPECDTLFVSYDVSLVVIIDPKPDTFLWAVKIILPSVEEWGLQINKYQQQL